jgi:hypothetical protein
MTDATTYKSTAVQVFADQFEPMGNHFLIDAGGSLGRYSVTASEKSDMIDRYAAVGWPKLVTLGAILMIPATAAVLWKYGIHSFRISIFCLWLSPLLIISLLHDRHRVRKALAGIPVGAYLGPSRPFYRRWIDSRLKQNWGGLLYPGVVSVALLLPRLKPFQTALDWADNAVILACTALVIGPLIAKAWHRRQLRANI